ncbi:hypothetical protein LIER_42275 [Lithospermum erythrorhizon]|uniref:Uncharacterized protein n=1 Tax=Lithospermum erythrorhizon TaxID=34254 RepID=A0AAV3RS54_LITER
MSIGIPLPEKKDSIVNTISPQKLVLPAVIVEVANLFAVLDVAGTRGGSDHRKRPKAKSEVVPRVSSRVRTKKLPFA